MGPHVLGGGRLSSDLVQLGRAFHRDLHSDWGLLQHSTTAFAEGRIQSGRGPQLDSVLDLGLPLAAKLLASHLFSRSVARRIDALRHATEPSPRWFLDQAGRVETERKDAHAGLGASVAQPG